jgi:iron only hydrogenase large subunit-like protein
MVLKNSFDKYNSDQKKVIKLINGKQKTILMVAPSFVVDFDYKKFVQLMKGFGFDLVSELTFGAKVVNQNYCKYISKNKNQEKFIASVCPMIVTLVKKQIPIVKKYLLPFDSPMIATAKILKKQNPGHKIIFLSPCGAKKVEANKSGIIDAVITFIEMKEMLHNKKLKKIITGGESHLFDRFYNDFTKIYPLSGGLSATLHSKKIIKKEEIISCDNCTNIHEIFDNHPDKIFFELLFCKGGCIGGPGIESKLPILLKKKKVIDYCSNARREKIGDRKGINKYLKGLEFKTKFE